MRKNPTRRGGAMILVTITMGVAGILAMALLTSSSLQMRTSGNAVTGAEAEYVAETGVNIAMLYLQHPERFTGAKPDGYYPGEANINLGANAPGTVGTAVTYAPAADQYTVVSTGRVTTDQGTLTRTITSVLEPIPTGNVLFQPVDEALVLNGDIKLDSGMTVTGAPSAVRTLGKVLVASGGRLLGNAISDEITRSGSGELSGNEKSHRDASRELEQTAAAAGLDVAAILNGVIGLLFQPYVTAPASPTDPAELVPAPAYIPNLVQYKYRNALTGLTLTYNAQKLNKASYGAETLGATLFNPAGIYWTDQDTTLAGTTINGTLIVRNSAKVTVNPGMTRILPSNNYPALVADVIDLTDTSNFVVNGLVYARKFTADPGTAGALSVTGAMMLYDKVDPFPSDNYAGTVSIAYSENKARIRGFGMAVADTDIKALRIVSWSEN